MPRMSMLALLLLAAGCSSPAPRFMGVSPQVTRVGPYVFDVYALDGEAQVIRTNMVALPDTAEVMAAASVAAEQATGCRTRKGGVSGDAALVAVRLACGAGG
ncbi:hypothetical protein GE300_05920 [Rhodobacteraceae bacterium 2CG4]|uniref:Lipoprotein n=1 Tax=Halovulum marinum TaxID=2662447 RepID=A0A6L5YY81_9RHOB|nr:hypothetical protein [Halovulum marinum]MSU89158.1 hypothetical protein [Halovulum marinum]